MPAHPRTTEEWKKKLGEEDILDNLQSGITASGADYVPGDNLEEASFTADQVIEIAKTDLNMLAGLAIPTVFQYMFPATHLAIWEYLLQVVGKIETLPKLALGIPRGRAKTTLMKLFILYCILFTNKKFILVVAATASLSENIIADVVDMLNERNIMRLFGDWKIGCELDRQDLKKFGFRGRTIIIAGLGVGGSIRGLNLKNERPDIMIFDDIQTKEDAESEVLSNSIERWLLGTAMKARSPHGCLYLFLANMYPTAHSILRKLKKNPSWVKFISGAILADGTSIWPELYPLEAIIAELDHDIEAGHPEIFFSEVMNDTETGTNNRVELTAIMAWPFSKQDRPQGKFIVIDPGGVKKKSDATAMGYFETYDAIPWLRQVIEEKLSPGNIIRRALILALKNGVKVIAVESTAYQQSLLYWFNELATQFGIQGIHFVELYRTQSSKNSMINDALKSLQQKELGIHPDIKNIVTSQIVNWNPLKRDNVDNILDLLTYPMQVIEKYGSIIGTEMDLDAQEASTAKVGTVEENVCF